MWKIFAKIFGDYHKCGYLYFIKQSQIQNIMKANCNITGIEFEATSGRQKNHPEVSQLMNDLNKYEFERYHDVKKALTARKGTFQSIDEVIEFAKNVKTSTKEEIYPGDTNTDAVYY